MSIEAKRTWIQFFNAVESGLNYQGQWAGLQDFASKAAENAARLAALFHLFEGKMGDIGSESMEQAIAVIHWHLKETRRLFDTGNQTNELSDARTLFEWLKEKGLRQTTARDIQRLSPLRDIERRDNAIVILIEHQMARLTREGSKMTLELNPLCFHN